MSDEHEHEPEIERRSDIRSEQRSERREDDRDIRYEGAEEGRDVRYEGREEIRDTRYSIRETVRDEIQLSYRRFLRRAVPAAACAGLVVALVSGLALYDSQRISHNQATAAQIRSDARASCQAINELVGQSNQSRETLRASLQVLIVHLQQDVIGQSKPATSERLDNIAALEDQIQNITLSPVVDCTRLYGR